jgi:DNA-binding transcriptional regulator YdaS (Cro superfamily)
MKTIADAVNAVGGQVPLAKILGVNPSLISQWVTGRLKVAARHCLAIESATGVSRHDLRPDVFGPLAEQQDVADAA